MRKDSGCISEEKHFSGSQVLSEASRLVSLMKTGRQERCSHGDRLFEYGLDGNLEGQWKKGERC